MKPGNLPSTAHFLCFHFSWGYCQVREWLDNIFFHELEWVKSDRKNYPVFIKQPSSTSNYLLYLFGVHAKLINVKDKFVFVETKHLIF